jgi:signal transduction histidine kinase
VNPEVREAWRLTMGTCALVAGTQLLFAAVDAGALGALAAWLDVAHVTLAATGLVLLWVQRRTPSLLACQILFAMVTLFYLPDTWVSEIDAAARGVVRNPLVGHQYVVIGVAILAPGAAWFGGALMAVVLASSIGLWAWLAARHSLHGVAGEPWMTLVQGAGAFAFLWFRAQRRVMMQRLARARAEADALARMARLFLAVRDRTNTPLQTLELSTALLARRFPAAVPQLDRMEQAVTNLRELSAMLAATETWYDGPVDATIDLARELEEAARALAESAGDGAEPDGTPRGPLPPHRRGRRGRAADARVRASQRAAAVAPGEQAPLRSTT